MSKIGSGIGTSPSGSWVSLCRHFEVLQETTKLPPSTFRSGCLIITCAARRISAMGQPASFSPKSRTPRALSGVGDELERARLTAMGLPSLLPYRLSGVALVDESKTTWSLIVQKDGQQVGSPAMFA